MIILPKAPWERCGFYSRLSGDNAGLEQSQRFLNVHPNIYVQPEPPKGLASVWALGHLSGLTSCLRFSKGWSALSIRGFREWGTQTSQCWPLLCWCKLKTVVLEFYSIQGWGLSGLCVFTHRSQGHQQSQICPWWFSLLPPSLGWGGIYSQAHIKRNDFCTYPGWPITEPALQLSPTKICVVR